MNDAGYINVGKCRPPYTEDLVPEEHVKTTAEHVERYKQIRGEVEQRFGARTPKDTLAKV